MANTVRELHIFAEKTDPTKGITKYRIEVWEVFMGKRRQLKKFPVHGNQKERIIRRYIAQYRVQLREIYDHTETRDDGTEAQGEATAHGG